MLWKIVELPTITDEVRGGSLIIAEINKVTGNAFTAARRVYYIINTENQQISRGGHYHPVGGKQEILLALSGKAIFDLHGPGACQEGLILDRPTQALFIPGNVWHAVKLDPGTILVSIASTNYDAKESIPDLPFCSCKR